MLLMTLEHRTSPYAHWEFSSPEGDQLRIVPERGGLVTGWRCGGREVLYLDLERFLDPAQSVRGGIPVLFPICGGLPDNTLPLPQGNFTLAQHGFARQMPWQLSALDDGQGIALELRDDPTSRVAYPFAFLVRMELRLEPQALAIHTTVENRSANSMPFSFGLHPYFNLTNLNSARFEGLPDQCLNHLSMAETSTPSQMARLNDGVDLLVRPAGNVGLVDPEAGTSLELELSAPMDLAVIWTEPPRRMVCLEPWSGPRQALISGDHKLELDPGASCLLQTRYRVRALDTAQP